MARHWQYLDLWCVNLDGFHTRALRGGQAVLTIEDIDHTKTKARSPQNNGICERFHRTLQEEFYAIAFRKKMYDYLEMMQQDLDTWMDFYNHERNHSGRYCYGRTPLQTFLGSPCKLQRR